MCSHNIRVVKLKYSIVSLKRNKWWNNQPASLQKAIKLFTGPCSDSPSPAVCHLEIYYGNLLVNYQYLDKLPDTLPCPVTHPPHWDGVFSLLCTLVNLVNWIHSGKGKRDSGCCSWPYKLLKPPSLFFDSSTQWTKTTNCPETFGLETSIS